MRKLFLTILLFSFLWSVISLVQFAESDPPPASGHEPGQWVLAWSNSVSPGNPYLSYKIFAAVAGPWLDPAPKPSETVLIIPEGRSLDPLKETAAI